MFLNAHTILLVPGGPAGLMRKALCPCQVSCSACVGKWSICVFCQAPYQAKQRQSCIREYVFDGFAQIFGEIVAIVSGSQICKIHDVHSG